MSPVPDPELRVSCSQEVVVVNQVRRLTRSIEDRKIAGVCAGLAKYMGWDVATVRIAFLVLSILPIGFPGIVVYIIMWIVVPEEGTV